MKRQSGYWKLGTTVFCTVAAILLFYDVLFGSRVLLSVLKKLLHALSPVFYGAMMAYLLTPVVNFFEEKLFAKARGKLFQKGDFPAPGARAISILLSWVLVGLALYLLLSVLLPELYQSVLQLLGNVETYYNTIYRWVDQLLETNPELEHWVAGQMDAYYQDIKLWLSESLLPQAQQLMSAVSGGIMSLLNFAKDLLVGIIVSVYLLATKERCAARGRRILMSVTSRERASWLLRGAGKVNDIFSGFVRGKLLDSLIIGVLCFFGCSLFHFPYTPLVSVFIGITNVIPFFGPFLGAIPSTFLILLASPKKALYFAIFVLFLQQLDGNVIGPKILGEKTGLSSLGVIVAILVGGSFFGIPGMFFGVPVCASLSCALGYLVESRLRQKSLPLKLQDYTASKIHCQEGQKEEKP